MRSTNGFCRVALLVLSVAVATPLTVSAAQYHVANGAANCSDSNTGTEAMPFQTIGMAASIMQAGDTVLVHSGTYREWVNPPRGGNSEGARITYKAYPGDHVVIKGSERITSWTLVSGNVYKSDVPNSLFGSYNPFVTLLYDPNGYLDYGTGYHLGAVYVNGTPYVEQLTASAVTNSARTFYAEVGTSTTTIYINYSGSSTPSNDLTEINVRESVVRSSGTGRNYITIDGFAICHGAPQWASCAGSQTGMIVINSGNSWLIQNCRISDARTCGITGHGTANVVRNNIIERCGQCGIVGNGGGWFAGLIEGNIIQDINPGDQFGGHETAGIKCHGVVDLTIRNNIFRRITASKVSGHGIWLDYATQGCRVTRHPCVA